MPAGELLLDLFFLRQQPVHRVIHVIGARAGHTEIGRQRGTARIPPAHREQLGFRAHGTGHDQRVRDVPVFRRRAEQRPQPEPFCHDVRGGHVPVRD
jgi:hypothetical protein